MKRLRISYKKTLNHPKACKKKRSLFREKIARYECLGKPIVYIDKSGFAHDMPQTHGYSKIGERCFGTHDWGAKGRTNAKRDNPLKKHHLFDDSVDYLMILFRVEDGRE